MTKGKIMRLETAFKALRPAGKDLKFPVLSDEKIDKLDKLIRGYIDTISPIKIREVYR